MDARQAIEEKIAALEAQRLSIQDSIFKMKQRRNPSIALLPKDIQQMDHIAFNNALKPTLNQQNEVEKQIAQARADLDKYDRDQRYAATDQRRAAIAAVQAQRQQDAAHKQAKESLEDVTARAFGLGKGKGIDYLTKRWDNLYYDPKQGRIAVPPEKSTQSSKYVKGDTKAIKEVHDKLSDYAKSQDVKGSFNPSSFFDRNSYPVTITETEDGDRNYVYKTPGGNLTIPADEVEGDDGLQARYNEHFDAQNVTPEVSSGTKYIPVGTFNQANQALNDLTGEDNISPADRYLKSQTMNRLAQPALAMNSPASVIPANPTMAALGIEGAAQPVISGSGTSVPSISGGPDINTAFDRSPTASQFGSALLGTTDPIFAKIEADRKAAAMKPRSRVIAAGGEIGKEDEFASLARAKQILGKDAPEEDLQLAANKLLDLKRRENQSGGSGFRMIAEGADALGKLGKYARWAYAPTLVPSAVVEGVSRGADYLSPRIGPVLNMIPTSRNPYLVEEERRKQAIVDQVERAMNPYSDLP